MYEIVTTRHFMRRAKKFLRKHPDLRGRFTTLINELSRDPFQPHLKLHALSGKLEGIFAAGISHSYRLTLSLQVTEKEIILLDVGSHDEVYR
ncbi:type II toxin-antitoxin system YoeB family toxin [bacterium]|nr:type II toxin-antitoxin system YoeB family toxin [bacterium]